MRSGGVWSPCPSVKSIIKKIFAVNAFLIFFPYNFCFLDKIGKGLYLKVTLHSLFKTWYGGIPRNTRAQAQLFLFRLAVGTNPSCGGGGG